ncbi:hypothetical protein A3741_30035 [Oleiphilus sp. HI0069]|nr:hypothetical protein A3741_30035 [Oleiphilus sp. HI0069]
MHSSDWQARVKGQEDSIVAIGAAYPYVYDIFLIDNQGNILYTIEHEDDFGTNLFDGRYAQTKFSWLVQ